MSLSHSDVKSVLAALNEVRDYEFVEITLGEFVLRAAKTSSAMDKLRLSGAPLAEGAPGQATNEREVETNRAKNEPAPTQSTRVSEAEAIPEGMIAVRSPMAGIFYITPGPSEPEFVVEGGQVASDDTVCLVEVMKLFNSVKAPVAGSVHKILAAHGEPVEHDQILMIMEPSKAGGSD